MLKKLLQGLMAKLKDQLESGQNVAPAMLPLDETQPQESFDFGSSLMHRDQRQQLNEGTSEEDYWEGFSKEEQKEIDANTKEMFEIAMNKVIKSKEKAAKKAKRKAKRSGKPKISEDTDLSSPWIIDSEAQDIIRKGMQEGGEMEEQMGELMPEEAPIPLETTEEPVETQLPDEEMEDNYTDFVINEALDEEEEQYLLDRLSGDDQLSMIFDKVVETASEFSGSGSVEGPGSAVSDSIPARLSDGEFVITSKAANQIGPDTLQELMELAEQEANMGRQTAQAGGYVQEEDVEEEAIQPIVSEKVLPTGRILPESEVSKRAKANADLLNPRMSLFAS